MMMTLFSNEGLCFPSKCGQFLITRVGHKNHDIVTRRHLLETFYFGLITENFPFEDELDPFEAWEVKMHLREPETAGSFRFLFLFAQKNQLPGYKNNRL